MMSKPPQYTEKPQFGPVPRVYFPVKPATEIQLDEAQASSQVPRVYFPVKPATEIQLDEVQSSNQERYLTKEERLFLLILTGFTLFTVLCTATAIFLDKHTITESYDNPSICMLTDTLECQTVYATEFFRIVVEVCVRVDLLIGIILFVTAVVLTAFRIFNSQLLVGFLLAGIVKTTFINIALLLIVGNNVFYYDTVYNMMVGKCGMELCVDEESVNIVMAFILLCVSALATFFMTLLMSVFGSRMIRKYDDDENETIHSRYDRMMHFH